MPRLQHRWHRAGHHGPRGPHREDPRDLGRGGSVDGLGAVANGGRKPLPSTRRYLQGDGEELVFEQTSPGTGVAVKRIYRRCETEAASGGRSLKSGGTQSK
mmetsp:Transcript_72155/g.188178  ORF Transcript_72155/g.188178 Transcript_72155/m.188178 type:complete len:101 (+) Transcript_72155:404-706(+)